MIHLHGSLSLSTVTVVSSRVEITRLYGNTGLPTNGMLFIANINRLDVLSQFDLPSALIPLYKQRLVMLQYNSTVQKDNTGVYHTEGLN